MAVNYEQTYWCNKGKHQAAQSRLEAMIPREGSVNNPTANPALEKFRVANNCYYDLYNNGLCNRRWDFKRVFGFDAGDDDLTQDTIDQAEAAMDEIILAAEKEQLSPAVAKVESAALRVWWIPQVPMKPFRREVRSIREAKLLLETLADYDLFQFDNNIKPDYCNAGGLEVFEDGEWTDWYDDETGDGIDSLSSDRLAELVGV